MSASRRAASTKTRIETPSIVSGSFPWRPVAGRHPLKQGLKHNSGAGLTGTDLVAGRHPLKQGLKPTSNRLNDPILSGRRAASTKTRIETPYSYAKASFHPQVAGRHPLKQGLKHLIFRSKYAVALCRRAASTKTRIETLEDTAAAETIGKVSQGGIH